MKALLKKSLPLIALLCLSPIAALATTAVVDSLPPTCSANTEVYLPASSLGQLAGLYRCNSFGVWIFTPPISAADVISMGISSTPTGNQTITGPYQLILTGGGSLVADNSNLVQPVGGINNIQSYADVNTTTGSPNGRANSFYALYGWHGATPTAGIESSAVMAQAVVDGGSTNGNLVAFLDFNPHIAAGSTVFTYVPFYCDHAAISSVQVIGPHVCFSGYTGAGGWGGDFYGSGAGGGSAAFGIGRACHSDDAIANGGVPTDCWSTGTGSPNGVVSAAVGSFYAQRDGGAGTSIWFKETGSGNTGWRARSDFTGSTVTVGLLQEPLSTPVNSSATCTSGQLWADASFVYVCTATNTIKRAALSSF